MPGPVFVRPGSRLHPGRDLVGFLRLDGPHVRLCSPCSPSQVGVPLLLGGLLQSQGLVVVRGEPQGGGTLLTGPKIIARRQGLPGQLAEPLDLPLPPQPPAP